QEQGMGARIRARTAARDRAVDGLDQLGRHAPAGAAAFRYRGGGGRLLRAPWYRLSGVGTQSACAPHHLLRRQFFLPTPRSLDALTPATNVPSPVIGPSLVRADHCPRTADFCSAQIAKPASAAMPAIIRKKPALLRLLQKPPRKPARMSAGSVAANQTPIIIESRRAGAVFEISAS